MKEELKMEIKQQKSLPIARFISYLFHPLLMPTYGITAIYFSNLVPGFNRYGINETLIIPGGEYIGWVFLLTALLPGSCAIYFKKVGWISSIQMPRKEERLLPFVVTGIFYVGLHYLPGFIYEAPTPFIINIFLLGSLLSIVLGVTVTFLWKISVHMIGIGGVTGIFFLLSVAATPQLNILILCVLLAGFIGYSRLALSAHTVPQVFAGFLLGFFCESFWVLLIT